LFVAIKIWFNAHRSTITERRTLNTHDFTSNVTPSTWVIRDVMNDNLVHDIVPIVLGALLEPIDILHLKDQHLPIHLGAIDVDDDVFCKQ
jgi:hypothetical protein